MLCVCVCFFCDALVFIEFLFLPCANKDMMMMMMIMMMMMTYEHEIVIKLFHGKRGNTKKC